MKEFDLSFDNFKPTWEWPITVKTADTNGIQFNLELLKDGEPMDLTDSTIRLFVMAPSGLETNQNFTITDAEEGLAEVVLLGTMHAEIGEYSAEVEFLKGIETNRTEKFYYHVITSI